MTVPFPARINGLDASVTMIISLKIRAKVGDIWFASSTTGLYNIHVKMVL